ncbi:MAG: GDSL family lipase [Nocardioides sp.]|nr:GDSL family lipase [Nocardioides sp.]
MPSRSLPARSRLRAAAALVAVAALGLTGCQASAEPNDSEPSTSTSETATDAVMTRYVALGDSYTAAPLFPLADDEIISSCLRSKKNYPTMVGRRLDVEVVDVSCSGASTRSMFDEQRFEEGSNPAQLDSLDDTVDLVTLGIGANDFRFFSQMMFECLAIAETDPTGAPCETRNLNSKGKDRLERKLGEIRRNVTKVVRAIGKRAPEARILLIGYPQLLPDEGSCRAKLPLAEGDYAYVKGLNLRLAKTVKRGGIKGGAEYVDLVEASKGHDICSDQPWVAGVRGDPKRAMGLHPSPAEQRAVAKLVVEAVETEA